MNTVGLLLTAYFNALTGNTNGLSLYKLTVPETETGDYVFIYPEGGQDNNTKQSKNEDVIIKVDIVTRSVNDAAQGVCEAADTAINLALLPTPAGHGLTEPTGLQFLLLRRENYSYLIEATAGGGIIYRKVSRYIQRVHQTS